jgi:plasmid stabilization system protein ParE
MRLQIHADAKAEAREAVEWYESKRPGLGAEFLDELDRAFALIEAHPTRFPEYVETPKGRLFRRCRLRRFPYLVIYRTRDDVAEVLAISHAARRPGYWLHRAL